MSKAARHIGYCPCCEGYFKVRDGVLTNHGYQRPGWGHTIGACFGSLRTPHELSPELAESYREMARKHRQAKIAALACLDNFTEDRAAREKRDLENDLARTEMEIRRITIAIDGWEAQPLKPCEKGSAAVSEAKELRAAKKAEAKARRLTAKVASYQKRIDQALKSKNSRTLAEIWEGLQRQLPSIDRELSKAEALRLIDRDDVWVAFGLGTLVLSHWQNVNKPEEETLRRMKNRQLRLKNEHRHFEPSDAYGRAHLASMSLEWPPDLGGETKKGAKTLAEIQEKLG